MIKKILVSFIFLFLLILYGCSSMKGSTVVASLFPGVESPLYVPDGTTNFSSSKNPSKSTVSSSTKSPAASSTNTSFEYKTRMTKRGEILVLPKPIRFAFKKYGIGKYYNDSIAYVANYMKKYPNIRIIVEGHTDKTGRYKYNKSLSLKRSRSGIKRIVNLGIARNRLIESGLGYTISEYSPKRLNRRLEFIIIKNEADLQKYRKNIR